MRRAAAACALVLSGCQAGGEAGAGAWGSDATIGSVRRAIPNPDPQADDHFGGWYLASQPGPAFHLVTPIGTDFLVGSLQDDVGGITDARSFRLYDGFDGTLVADIEYPVPGARFGFATLALADSFVVQASEPGDPSGSGCLYQYDLEGNFLRKIPNPDPDAADYFGWPLERVGSNFVAVATYDDPGGVPDAGSAYLFDAQGGLLASIPNPEPETYDWFGPWVEAVGANFAVTSRDDGPAEGAGRGYLFDGASGALIAALSDPDPQSYEWFGVGGALDLGDGRFAVSSRSDRAPDGAHWPGSVHIFDASTGVLERTLQNPAGTSNNDQFGSGMATDGADRIAVYAYAVGGTNAAGIVHLFRASTGALIASMPNPRPPDAFFNGILFESGRVLVPSPSARSPGGIENAGAVYVFDTGGNLVTTLENPAPAEGGWFGYPLAFTGGTVAVGLAKDTSDGVAMPGRISVFDLDGTLLSSVPNPGLVPEGIWYPQGLFAVADNFVLSSPFDAVSGVPGAGSLYLIAGPNDPPVAVPDAAAAVEDVDLAIDVLANDGDPDRDGLFIESFTQPASGTVAVAGTLLVYTPATHFNGLDSFEYVATDGIAPSAPATVSVSVAAVNDAPAGAADAYSGQEETPLVVAAAAGVLANDADVEGGALTAALAMAPNKGSVSLASDGGFTYTPDPDAWGVDVFRYSVSDGVAASTAQVVLTLANTSDPMAVASDAYAAVEDQPLDVGAAAGVLANDVDPDGGLTATLSAGASHGSVTLAPSGALRYEPAADYSGPDDFRYVVTDVFGESAEVTVTLDVTPVNDPPAAPVLLSPAPHERLDDRDVRLEWSAAADLEVDPLLYRFEVVRFGMVMAEGETGELARTLDLEDGPYSWSVAAFDGIDVGARAEGTFLVREPMETAGCACALNGRPDRPSAASGLALLVAAAFGWRRRRGAGSRPR